MNRKKTMILSFYLIAGVIFIVGGCIMKNDYYSTLVFAMGVGLSVSAVMNLYREYRNTRPENRAEYEAKLKEQAINIKDERKVFLRYKASYRTMQLSIMICFFGAAILAWLRVDVTIVAILFVMAIVQYLTASVIYKYFCAKM